MPCVYLPGPAPAVTVANSNGDYNIFSDEYLDTKKHKAVYIKDYQITQMCKFATIASGVTVYSFPFTDWGKENRFQFSVRYTVYLLPFEMKKRERKKVRYREREGEVVEGREKSAVGSVIEIIRKRKNGKPGDFFVGRFPFA
jgi:hypothetical protein